MPGKSSAIPVGTQFSPALINLPAYLAACVKHSGDKDAMMNAVWGKNVRIKAPAKAPTFRRRSLPLEAGVQYELLKPETYEATDLAVRLAGLADGDLYPAFARHILLDLGGLRVVEAAQQMKLDGLKPTGDRMSRYLTDQGFQVGEHNTQINSLRMWLAKVGVFSERGWEVDAMRKQEIAGLDDEMIASLVGLNPKQQAFAIALCRINPQGKHPAAEIRNTAEAVLGRSISRASLPKVLAPLKQAGLIDFETKGTAGGKTSILWTTDKFEKDVLEPFLERATKSLDSLLTAYYKKPPAEIYDELGSQDTSVKGKALEAAGKKPITTQIAPAGPFYYAEDYHQQYLHKVPNGYCGLKGTGVECRIQDSGLRTQDGKTPENGQAGLSSVL